MFTLFKTKCILMTREYIALFFTIIFCPMLLIIFGTIYGNEPTPIFNNLGTVDISVPAYVGFVFAGSGLISLPVAVAGSKERGELRRFQMTPLSPFAYLIADVVVYFIVSIIGMAILTMIGYFVFNSAFNGNIWFLVLGLIVTGLSTFSIGLVIASLSKNAKIAQSIGMVVGFPMMFLSGAGLPVELMSASMRNISRYLPLSYCVSLMRNIWIGAPFEMLKNDILILIVISIIFISITIVTFKWE